MAKIMGKPLKIPVYLLNEIYTGTLGQITMGKTVRRGFIRIWMGEKIANRDCMFAHRKQGLFLSENVDDIKVAGKKSMVPMWKKLI